MQDNQIVVLYWARNEQAIDATAKSTADIAIVSHSTYLIAEKVQMKA
jgi:hypothetical protein